MNATEPRSAPTAVTGPLLIAGALGGPVFVISSIVQAVTREGFDPLRHAVSQLVLGPGGVVQIVTFVVAGVLMILGSIGLHRVLRGGRGARAVPVLIAIEGAGFIAAGIFPADPGNGFPPESEPAFSATGIVHLACAGIAFIALIAACFVLANRITKEGGRAWAIAGRVSAILLALGFLFANTGMTGGPLALLIGATIAWVWFGLTLVSPRRLASSLDEDGDDASS